MIIRLILGQHICAVKRLGYVVMFYTTNLSENLRRVEELVHLVSCLNMPGSNDNDQLNDNLWRLRFGG